MEAIPVRMTKNKLAEFHFDLISRFACTRAETDSQVCLGRKIIIRDILVDIYA